MRAGRLRYRVTLQRNGGETTDSMGQPIPAWTDLGEEWADYQPQRGREYFAASGQVAVNPAAFLLRWAPGQDIKATDRVWFQDKPWDVRAVVQDERAGETWLYADTGLTQG